MRDFYKASCEPEIPFTMKLAFKIFGEKSVVTEDAYSKKISYNINGDVYTEHFKRNGRG